MTFQEKLNEYLDLLGCSTGNLAEASGLSAAVISRYKNGNRKPAPDSEQLQKIADGLSSIALQKNIKSLNKSLIINELSASLQEEKADFTVFSHNFDQLVKEMGFSMKSISVATSFEVSHLYRIRSGLRRPTDLEKFTNDLAHFMVNSTIENNSIEKIAGILGESPKDIENPSDFYTALVSWLFTKHSSEENTVAIENFLKKLDDFDLNEYIRTIHFDEMKVPTAPFTIQRPKHLYGLEGYKRGELDFFKTTVLSRSNKPIFMCSDMPMEDMAEDKEFGKKWMFALAMSLKKGLHMDVIHDTNRPFNEMVLGLLSWLPLYMTGQVSPYCFEDYTADIYHHATYVSGACAYSAECINGSHNEGRCYVSAAKEDIAYNRKRANELLAKASPVMQIINKVNTTDPANVMFNLYSSSDNISTYSCVPSLFTLDHNFLADILDKNKADETTKNNILSIFDTFCDNFHKMIKTATITENIYILSEEEFANAPIYLPLSNLFADVEIRYSYEDYCRHIELAGEFQASNPNYSIVKNNSYPFKNMYLHYLNNNSFVLSKNQAPYTHFYTENSRLVSTMLEYLNDCTKFIPKQFD
ncbi:MAG: hypothetical protein K6D96_08260 [Acetatifactor sp.]|nr:hypothetical protein [Acetatifactor sp.]